MAELTQAYVLSLFSYRDGNLFWKVARSNVKAGDLVGYVNKRGYREIGINGKLYYAHRLIFLYHHGYLPEVLDHIDGDESNNCISNIRKATQQQNCMNSKKNKSYGGQPTTSCYKGVAWDKSREKWRSYIQIGGKSKHLGRFASEIEAAEAYDKAALERDEKFAKLNFSDQKYHIDTDRWDNLREATIQESAWNREKTKFINGNPTSSIYKGVVWSKHAKKWRAYIKIDKQKHLGYFTSEIEAAEAYNTAATKHFGEFACLNILPKPL